MPDAKPESRNDATQANGAPAKGSSSVKIILAVVILMVVEAAGIYFFVGKTGPKPAEAAVEGKDETNHDSVVEVPLIEDKFQNMSTGRVWVWDAGVVLKVKKKNEEYVAEQLEARAAEIKEGISMIFRRAQHSQLKEPGLETVNRQLLTYVNKTLGTDAEGLNRVERVLIPKCKGFPAD